MMTDVIDPLLKFPKKASLITDFTKMEQKGFIGVLFTVLLYD